MKVIFKSEGRKFTAEVEGYEDILNVIYSGLMAMGYHKCTASQLIEEVTGQLEK